MTSAWMNHSLRAWICQRLYPYFTKLYTWQVHEIPCPTGNLTRTELEKLVLDTAGGSKPTWNIKAMASWYVAQQHCDWPNSTNLWTPVLLALLIHKPQKSLLTSLSVPDLTSATTSSWAWLLATFACIQAEHHTTWFQWKQLESSAQEKLRQSKPSSAAAQDAFAQMEDYTKDLKMKCTSKKVADDPL